VHITFTPHETIARTLKAQPNPMDWIIAFVPNEYIKPPIPLPAAAMLFAKDRFLENHCGTIPTLATNRKPIPTPKARPWERNRCQILFAHDAPSSPAVSKRIPMPSVFCVPNFLAATVAMGEMIKAIEMERPPINAYSRDVAPGNVLLDR
jgi:hypothetical protein